MAQCSRTRYGLDETTFAAVERLDVNEPVPDAQQWLAERVSGGELLLVFGRDEVFRVPAALLPSNWRDMFCPSRDDVVIVPVGGDWVLFYCHEDEFEFSAGVRRPTPPQELQLTGDAAAWVMGGGGAHPRTRGRRRRLLFS